jgi:hypothetical protein
LTGSNIEYSEIYSACYLLKSKEITKHPLIQPRFFSHFPAIHSTAFQGFRRKIEEIMKQNKTKKKTHKLPCL